MCCLKWQTQSLKLLLRHCRLWGRADHLVERAPFTERHRFLVGPRHHDPTLWHHLHLPLHKPFGVSGLLRSAYEARDRPRWVIHVWPQTQRLPWAWLSKHLWTFQWKKGDSLLL